jgi:hypothetical protein
VLAASIIKAISDSETMMETESTSETLVNFYRTTWRYNTEKTTNFILTALRTSNPT